MLITLKTRQLNIKMRMNKKKLKFDELPKKGQNVTSDFFYLLYNSLNKNTNKSFSIFNNINKIYRINKIEIDKANRCIYGLIKYGEKGIVSDLAKNQGNGDLVTTYSRNKNEYELQNYFFLIYVPKQRNQGYVIVQANSRQTIIGALEQEIYNALNGFNDNLIYKMNRYVLKNELYSVLQDSKINNISFIGHNPAEDIADFYNVDTGKCVVTTTLSKINKQIERKIFGSDYRYLKKGVGVQGGIEFNIGHSYDDIKINVTYNKREKVISLSKDLFDMDENITDIVIKDANNNPNYQSIKKLAFNKLKELI